MTLPEALRNPEFYLLGCVPGYSDIGEPRKTFQDLSDAGKLPIPKAPYGANSSNAIILHFSPSLVQSSVNAAGCSPGVRKLNSIA